jgi:hypothetical protein
MDVHLDEVPGLHDPANEIAIGAIRRDERGDVHHAGFGEELGDLADAANVLGAVFRGESEILVEAVADIVTVEHEGAHAAFP